MGVVSPRGPTSSRDTSSRPIAHRHQNSMVEGVFNAWELHLNRSWKSRYRLGGLCLNLNVPRDITGQVSCPFSRSFTPPKSPTAFLLSNRWGASTLSEDGETVPTGCLWTTWYHRRPALKPLNNALLGLFFLNTSPWFGEQPRLRSPGIQVSCWKSFKNTGGFVLLRVDVPARPLVPCTQVWDVHWYPAHRYGTFGEL